MRVLMLAWEYPPHMVGGMGRHVAELAPALAALGVYVHVLTPQARGGALLERDGRLTVQRVPLDDTDISDYLRYTANANRTLVDAAERLSATTTKRFDILHAHDWLMTDVAVTLKHAWRCPLVATIHATERGRGRGTLPTPQAVTINQVEWHLGYEAWRVIVCSQFMAEEVAREFDLPANKVSVIPNGIRIPNDPLPNDSARRTVRRQYVRAGERLVIYVGRVVREKGVHVLLDAWPRVLAQYPGARLAIAGTGPELPTLRDRANALGLHDVVHFLGFISDDEREKLYRIADAAAFPSLYEPFGIVALEAMASACPVIVAQSGGLAEVVSLHETGIVVHPDNPESLAWGIVHTLRHPQWARKRAANALTLVRQRYNWPQIAADTATVYERIRREWLRGEWGGGERHGDKEMVKQGDT